MRQQSKRSARVRWIYRACDENPAIDSRERAKAKRRARMNRAARRKEH